MLLTISFVDVSTVRWWVRRCKEALRWRGRENVLRQWLRRQDLFPGQEYMPLLKGGPKRWKWTEIILKSDKLIVNVVVFKLCNCIWVFFKIKGDKNRRHYLLTNPRIYLFTYLSTCLSIHMSMYLFFIYICLYLWIFSLYLYINQ